ncbi:hypothetical protein NFJ02_36g90030 [Pycnococcus provasolii]
MARRGVRRGRRLRQSSSYWTETYWSIGRRLIEVALAYDAACVQHKVKQYRNFCVPVKSQREKVMASLPLCYKNGSIPPGWRKKTTREKLMASVANAVERDNSTRPHKLSSLECQTYSSAAISELVERHNQHAGGDPQIFDEYNSLDDEKVMEEPEKLEKTAAKAAAKSSRGMKVWTSIAALRVDMPHVADAVIMLMARSTRRSLRIQVNLYGDDDDDLAIHYVCT